jgi:integrase
MGERENLTAGRMAAFACPEGKAQAFLWDKQTASLALRVTAAGSRAFVFQSRLLSGESVRLTIGEPVGEDGRGIWTIPLARAEARRLQGLIDQGRDPRIERAATAADHAAKREAVRADRQRAEVTGLDGWAAYCAERRPHWSDRNHADHLAFVREGGAARERAPGKKTVPGPLRRLLAQPLAELGPEAVQGWVEAETKTRPARAALGFRLLRAFVNWCAEHPDYRGIVRADACAGKRTREKVARVRARCDALQREQLAAWFAEVRRDPNPAAGAYLQCLLLLGCRREELAGLRWGDVDFEWRAARIADKVEASRTIPLPPYAAHLLRSLPKRPGNPFVFSSATGAEGRLRDARGNHTRALARAGLPHVSLHGLRRSFGTLAEWVEAPVGVVAQIQGHKPSAIAEKHYRVRPLDLLRLWHDRIEGFILAEAGIAFEPAKVERAPLRVVAAA